MQFNEKHMAFLSATFYLSMKAEKLPNYQEVFALATRLYGQQRGSRMAQRALRDGRELNFAAYRHYAEWSFTQEMKEAGLDRIDTQDEGKNRRITVHTCPFYAQYCALDAEEGGRIYCSELDRSLVRGFNPALRYEVLHLLYDNPTCMHMQYDAKTELDNVLGDKNPADQRDFAYQCGHVYHSYARTIEALYGSCGRLLSAKVLETYEQAFGRDLADRIHSQRLTDFNYMG